MPFEWDENRRKWNIDNRQMDFSSADDFDMSTATHHVDRRRTYGEVRFVSVGIFMTASACFAGPFATAMSVSFH